MGVVVRVRFGIEQVAEILTRMMINMPGFYRYRLVAIGLMVCFFYMTVATMAANQGVVEERDRQIHLLKSSHDDIRAKAVRVLCRLGPQAESVLENLVAMLDDPSLSVRMALYDGAGRVPGLARPVAERLTIKLAHEQDEKEVRYGFAKLVFAQRLIQEAGDILNAALDKAPNNLLDVVAETARRTGMRFPAHRALELYERSPATMSHWFVCWAEYAREPHPKIIEILRRELREGKDGWHLARAANGLQSIGPAADAAVAELTGLLHHPFSPARRYAARALAGIGGNARSALPQIAHMANNDPDREVRSWAAKAAEALRADR